MTSHPMQGRHGGRAQWRGGLPKTVGALVALVAVFALVVSGCSSVLPTAAPSAATGSGTPNPGGSLPSGTESIAPATADPAIVAGLVPWTRLDRRWGTYVSEREWGNPRESVGGNGWGMTYLAATSTPYVSGEDGIAAWSDSNDEFHVGWAFWDGRQRLVTERLYGLSNPAGVNGETILDRRSFGLNTLTHSFASYRLQYPRPQLNDAEPTSTTPAPTPPWDLRLDAAKVDSSSFVMRATITNTTSAIASLHVILKGWFAPGGPSGVVASSTGLVMTGRSSVVTVAASPATSRQASDDKAALDRNLHSGALSGDGPGRIGALDYAVTIGPGASTSLSFGVVEAAGASQQRAEALRVASDGVIAARQAEAEAAYSGKVAAHEVTYRDALSALLWSESHYRWDGSGPVGDWQRRIAADAVLIVPDKWEFPWLASWDTAFQAVAASLIDPDLAAAQLRFVLSSRWQQPDGHVPCAEWVMGDECPPVLGWAALRVADAYASSGRTADGTAFLGDVYPALVREHAYWQRTEGVGGHLYAGGFLGMDNLPRGAAGSAQADGSAWMAAFAGDLASIAKRLGRSGEATQFSTERAAIATAVNAKLWDDRTGFYYDLDGTDRIKSASYSGLVPLIAGIVPAARLPRVLAALRDPARFLSPYGVRSTAADSSQYAPGYAGGGVNSNWLGPIWVPISYRIVEALRPVDPALAHAIARRTVATVEADHLATGRFHEYFDAATGAGLGADEQTGWTALVANLIAEEWPAH